MPTETMRSKVSLDVAIVLQAEIDAVGEARIGCARSLRDAELLLRQRHAGRARAGDAGEIERHAAEAAADVEHRLALVDQQLGGDMALLGELGLFERLARMLEIGAGILPVGVEEEIVNPPVEVVVMGDVALCARLRSLR